MSVKFEVHSLMHLVDCMIINLFFVYIISQKVKEKSQAMISTTDQQHNEGGALSDPLVRNTEQERRVEEEENDNDNDKEPLTVEVVETRMWRDRMLLRKLKDERKERERGQTIDMVKKKAMTRAQDTILRNMLKMMEVCDVQGFVYGIIPEKGKPVSGASDNLRSWWKDRIRFDRNGPAAMAR